MSITHTTTHSTTPNQSVGPQLQAFVDAVQRKDPKDVSLHLQQLAARSEQAFEQEESSSELKGRVRTIMGKESLLRYAQIREKVQGNEAKLAVIVQGKTIMRTLQTFLKADHLDMDTTHSAFQWVLDSIVKFEQLSLPAQVSFATLREQLYTEVLLRLAAAHEAADSSRQDFKRVLAEEDLPLKKDEVRDKDPCEANRKLLVGYLHAESCLLTLERYVLGLLDREEKSTEGLLALYWERCMQPISYLFISDTELSSFQEPGWMFEYLQLAFNSNYRYLLDRICREGKADHTKLVCTHFLRESISSFFLPLITRRFHNDLPSLTPFLTFNFIDELAQLEEKLLISFGVRGKVVERLLGEGGGRVVSVVLDYEASWFGSKVFDDFANINYSNVNLKNLDAFNILTNFLALFEKLHRKYVNITTPALSATIAGFYRRQVLGVVAHIKTSFDRIYHHSKFAKLDVLLSFKRIENELRANLQEFLASDRELEEQIQKEYYLFLSQYFQACALETLTSVHRKMHISLGEVLEYLSSREEAGQDRFMGGFGKIYEEWAGKVEAINKFAPYCDNKIRTIFFTYLQATHFSDVGLNFYLKIYEPFLRLLLSEDRHRTLLALITMQPAHFHEYLDSHPNCLAFLSKEEVAQLHRFKTLNFPN